MLDFSQKNGLWLKDNDRLFSMIFNQTGANAHLVLPLNDATAPFTFRILFRPLLNDEKRNVATRRVIFILCLDISKNFQ
jgi:hypothetical protein